MSAKQFGRLLERAVQCQIFDGRDLSVQYQIFDGRFRLDPERAICLYMADGLEDAIRERPEYGIDAVIVAIQDGGDYEIVEVPA